MKGLWAILLLLAWPAQATSVVRFPQVHFAAGSAEVLDPQGVDFMFKLMRDYPEIATLTIHGHADPGEVSHKRAQALSETRAQAVRQLLIARGLSPDRLVVIGESDGKPLTLQKRDRARNRRVEFTIVTKDGP